MRYQYLAAIAASALFATTANAKITMTKLPECDKETDTTWINGTFETHAMNLCNGFDDADYDYSVAPLYAYDYETTWYWLQKSPMNPRYCAIELRCRDSSAVTRAPSVPRSKGSMFASVLADLAKPAYAPPSGNKVFGGVAPEMYFGERYDAQNSVFINQTGGPGEREGYMGGHELGGSGATAKFDDDIGSHTSATCPANRVFNGTDDSLSLGSAYAKGRMHAVLADGSDVWVSNAHDGWCGTSGTPCGGSDIPSGQDAFYKYNSLASSTDPMGNFGDRDSHLPNATCDSAGYSNEDTYNKTTANWRPTNCASLLQLCKSATVNDLSANAFCLGMGVVAFTGDVVDKANLINFLEGDLDQVSGFTNPAAPKPCAWGDLGGGVYGCTDGAEETARQTALTRLAAAAATSNRDRGNVCLKNLVFKVQAQIHGGGQNNFLRHDNVWYQDLVTGYP